MVASKIPATVKIPPIMDTIAVAKCPNDLEKQTNNNIYNYNFKVSFRTNHFNLL